MKEWNGRRTDLTSEPIVSFGTSCGKSSVISSSIFGGTRGMGFRPGSAACASGTCLSFSVHSMLE
jgi:hypothetical protein